MLVTWTARFLIGYMALSVLGIVRNRFNQRPLRLVPALAGICFAWLGSVLSVALEDIYLGKTTFDIFKVLFSISFFFLSSFYLLFLTWV